MKKQFLLLLFVMLISYLGFSQTISWKGITWDVQYGTAAVVSGNLVLTADASGQAWVHVNQIATLAGASTPWIQLSYMDVTTAGHKIDMLMEDEAGLYPRFACGSMWTGGEIFALRRQASPVYETYLMFEDTRRNIERTVYIGKRATGTLDVNFDGKKRSSTYLNQIVGGSWGYKDVYLRLRGAAAGATVTFTNFTYGTDHANQNPTEFLVTKDDQNVVMSLKKAVDESAAGDVVNVLSGTYAEGATINVNKAISIIGATAPTRPVIQTAGGAELFDVSAGATIRNLDITKTDKSTQAIIRVRASNILIDNCKVHGQYIFGEGDVSRALVVNAGGFSGIQISNNEFYSLRQPAYISGTSTGNITNNLTYGTRGWVIEGGNLTFTGNTWGTGAQANVFDIAIIPSCPPAYYSDIVAMSAANSNAVIEDQRVTSALLSVVYVDKNSLYPQELGSLLAPYKTITPALSRVVAGGTIYVADGTYNEDLTIGKTLKLIGEGMANTIIIGPIGGGSSTIQVAASNVLIEGFTITRDGNNPIDWNNPALNTAGIAVQSLGNFAEIRNNTITKMRTAIDINNSNGNNIHNNIITDNRTGMIMRNQTDNMQVTENTIINNWTVGILFLDGSTGTNSPVQTAANSVFAHNNISGNWYGQAVDRQTGGSLPAPGGSMKNFENNYWGTLSPVVSTANSTEPGYAVQIPVSCGGTAVAPGGQADILGVASANIDYTPWCNSTFTVCEFAPINTSIGTLISTSCGILEVPITVRNFNAVGVVSLMLNYNSSILTYSAALNQAFTGLIVNNPSTGKIFCSYYGAEKTLAPNAVLFTLRFSVVPNILGTPFNLTWSTEPEECQYAGLDGDPIYTSATFNNLNTTIITDEVPVVTCVGAQSRGTVATACTYTAVGTEFDPTAKSDNCAITGQTYELTGMTVAVPTAATTLAGVVFNKGVTTVKWVVTDAGGNSANCSFDVTVADDDAPTALCKPNTVTLDAFGAASITAAQVDNGSFDNCGPVTLNVSPSTFACANAELVSNRALTVYKSAIGDLINWTLPIVNNTGNTITALKINYDMVNPLSRNTSVGARTSLIGWKLNGVDIGVSPTLNNSLVTTGFDNRWLSDAEMVALNLKAVGQVISLTGLSIAPGATYQLAFGNFYNTASKNMNVGIDNITITTGSTVIYQNNFNTDISGWISSKGSPTVPAPYVDATANVGGQSYDCFWSYGFPSPVATPVTLTATDEAGLSSACTAMVTVVDNTPPTINCPADLAIETNVACTYVGAIGLATATDNCTTAPTITSNAPASFPLGATTVIWSAKDASGNISTCNQVVTVTDDDLPVITVPGPVTVLQQDAKDPYATGYATAVDNCTNPVIITYDDNRAGLNLCNSTGLLVRTWTAMDAAGNTAIGIQNITVHDNLDPIVVVPGNITVDTDPGLCSAVVTYTAPTATDFGYFQGFEDANYISGAAITSPSTDWNDSNSKLTRVVSLTDGITSKTGSAHGVANSTILPASPEDYSGIFSRLGGYYNSFGNGFVSSVDVYLDVTDPKIALGTYGWDVSTAAYKQDLTHLRDFIFHAAGESGKIMIAASNNSNYARRGDLASLNHYDVTASGWYTLKWTFRNNAGVLAVDCQVLNAGGTVLWTETRTAPTDLIASVVGGNGYMWFTFIAVDKLAIDNTTLTRNLSITPASLSGTAFAKGTTNVTAKATDACGKSTSATFSVTVVDNENPVIPTCASAQSAIVTNGCAVAMPDFASTAIATDNCSGVVKTQFPLAGTMMEYQATSYEVTITATDAEGNIATCLSNFTVNKASISGIMKYHKPTGINDATNIDVALNNIGLTLYSMPAHTQVGIPVTTAVDGSFSFGDLCAGQYSVEVTSNGKGVGGINTTDAAKVNKWGVSGGTIEYVKFLAGDVAGTTLADGQLYINNNDAQMIQDYFVSGYASQFNRLPWSYWAKGVKIAHTDDSKPTDFNVTVSGANVTNHNLYGMVTGDFNGTFIPNPTKSATWSLELNNNGIVNSAANQEFELPLRAASAMQVGAVSMILNIPSGLVSVQDVKVNGSKDRVSWAVNGNELRIGWYSTTPVDVAENGKLITLNLKSTNAFTVGQTMEFVLPFDPLNELADGNFEVIQDANLLVAQVGNGVTGILNPADNNGLSLSNYPNPFKNSTTVSYALPVQGKVTIHVYNSLGQLVKSLVDANQNAGSYSIRMDGNNLMPGIYIAKLRLTKTNVDMTGTVKLSVLK